MSYGRLLSPKNKQILFFQSFCGPIPVISNRDYRYLVQQNIEDKIPEFMYAKILKKTPLLTNVWWWRRAIAQTWNFGTQTILWSLFTDQNVIWIQILMSYIIFVEVHHNFNNISVFKPQN
jgi:hypothetical protein